MKYTTIRATMAAGTAAVLIGAFSISAPAAQAAENCFGLTPTIVGTEGDDTINGTAGDDVIVGLGSSRHVASKSAVPLNRVGADKPRVLDSRTSPLMKADPHGVLTAVSRRFRRAS